MRRVRETKEAAQDVMQRPYDPFPDAKHVWEKAKALSERRAQSGGGDGTRYTADGDSTDYVFVEDVIQAVAEAMEVQRAVGGSSNDIHD